MVTLFATHMCIFVLNCPLHLCTVNQGSIDNVFDLFEMINFQIKKIHSCFGMYQRAFIMQSFILRLYLSYDDITLFELCKK